MTTKLLLGDTDLTEFVNEQEQCAEISKTKRRRLHEINCLLREYDPRSFPMEFPSEEAPLKGLREKKWRIKHELDIDEKENSIIEKYPRIDTSFLEWHSNLEYRGAKLQVPRFSLHAIGDSNLRNSLFEIYITTRPNSLTIEEIDRMVEDYAKRNDGKEPSFFDWNRSTRCLIESGGWDFPPSKDIIRQLESSIGFDCYTCDINAWTSTGGHQGSLSPEVRRELEKIYGWSGRLSRFFHSGEINMLSLRTGFYGLIPEKTKEKLIEAKKIILGNNYGTDNEFYIIKETKPEEWDVSVRVSTERDRRLEEMRKRLAKDPILIGIAKNSGGRAYLIDHFDTTPVEHYLASEFSYKEKK